MVQLLLDHGAQVNPTADGETSALMLASGIRNGEIVKMLLERGAKVDLHNESKAFALMLAARRGNVEVVKELLERGADVNLKGKGGSTALLSVLLDMEWGIPQQSIVDIVKLLLEYGADVKVRDDDNRTTIHAAIITKSAEIVKLLLDKDKDLVNQDGSMDLHNALMFGSPDIVQILLDAGADPNSESYGKTPLMSSVLNINTAKMLIDSGANVDAQDNEGGYAMLYAIKEKNYEVVEFLLEKGADVSLQADNGDSVASILQRDSKQILVSKTSNINNYINNIPFLYTQASFKISITHLQWYPSLNSTHCNNNIVHSFITPHVYSLSQKRLDPNYSPFSWEIPLEVQSQSKVPHPAYPKLRALLEPDSASTNPDVIRGEVSLHTVRTTRTSIIIHNHVV